MLRHFFADIGLAGRSGSWLVALAVIAGAVPARADCGLALVAEVALRDTDGYLSIPVSLAGRPASMLIDTGSDAGLLSPGAARGLPVERGRVAHVSGTGGGARGVPVATVPTLGIGDLSLGAVPFPLGALPAFPRIVPPIAGLIGGDLLSHFEVEIDASGGVLRFYQAHELSSLCRDLPPWRGPVETVGLTPVGNRMALGVSLDGKPITALLDSGARSRIVSRRAALTGGVDAATLEAEPGGITSGIDGREVLYHWHRFDTLRVGGETDRNPVLTVTPLSDPFDMLLGADWFERHRVWVSYATSRLFFQAVGQR